MAVRITSSQYPGQQCSVILYSPTGNTIPYTNATSTNLGTQTLPFTYTPANQIDEYGVFDVTINSNQAPCTGVAKTPPDGDGNTYKIIKIGNQIWMSENLKTTKFQTGVALTNGEDSTTWINAITNGTKCWTYADGVSGNTPTYGLLYNQLAVTGSTQGSTTTNLCPSGYHVPTESELSSLITSIGGSMTARTTGTSVTLWSNGSGTNTFGFNAVPAGYRDSSASYGTNISRFARFWTLNNGRFLTMNPANVGFFTADQRQGTSVRCLKD